MTGEFISYLCFAKNDDEKEMYNVALMPRLEEIKNWREKPKSPGIVIGVFDEVLESKKIADAEGAKQALYQLMEKFRSSIYGYRLVQRVTSVLLPSLRPAYITQIMHKQASGRLGVVEDTPSHIIYGIKENEYAVINEQIGKLRELDLASSILPSAIILSLVATFDSLISDLLRIMLTVKSDRLANSDKKISVSDVMKMSSFDQVIERLVADEINNLMRGSHEETIDYLEKNLNVVIRKGYDKWGDFIEIFERRNLVAHGNLIVNEIYLKNCKLSGYETKHLSKGDRLQIFNEYIDQSADTLVEFGVLTVFVIWKKHFSESLNEAYGAIVNLTLNMIKNKRYAAAARIMQTVLMGSKVGVSDSTIKPLNINLANALKFQGLDSDYKRVIEGIDWSASAENFQICIASLNENFEEVCRIMPILKVTGAVTEEDYSLWPVFNWVRGNAKVQDKFKEIYGKDLASAEAPGEASIISL